MSLETLLLRVVAECLCICRCCEFCGKYVKLFSEFVARLCLCMCFLSCSPLRSESHLVSRQLITRIQINHKEVVRIELKTWALFTHFCSFWEVGAITFDFLSLWLKL